MTAQLRKTDHVWIYVRFRRDAGGYLGEAPGLPGCMTWAPTLDEAKTNITEAITGYMQVAFSNDIALELNSYLRTTPPEEASTSIPAKARKIMRPMRRHCGAQPVGEWQQQRIAVAT